MKYAPIVAGILLGLLFIMSASVVLFGIVTPAASADAKAAETAFAAAFGPTGYMTFIKVLELVGGILVVVPRTRNLGLLILGPIIVNILAYHIFVDEKGILNPMLLGISALALFLMWSERRNWLALVFRNTRHSNPSQS